MMKTLVMILLAAGTISARSTELRVALETFIRSQLGDTSAVIDSKCGTRYDMMIHAFPEYINPELRQSYLQLKIAAPVRDKSLLSASGNFMLHWDESGPHAVPLTDQSANGIPDYIDSAAVIFDYVRYREVEQMGYQAPPAQNGEPAVPYHVYFSELPYYGLTSPSYVDIPTLPGENYTSYIEVENDYLGFDTPGLDGLRVTAAHEFHHAIQLGYNIDFNDQYFWEMTSTLMEELLYPAINDYINYLYDLFNSVSNTRFTLANGEYPYANSLYLQMISSQYGVDIVRMIWEHIRSVPSLTAIRMVLQEKNTSWPVSLGEYGLWLYYTGERTMPGIFFNDAARFPQIRIRPVDDLPFDNSFAGQFTVEENANRYIQFSQISGHLLNIDVVADGKTAGFRGLTRFTWSAFYPANDPLLNQFADDEIMVVILTNAGDGSQVCDLSLTTDSFPNTSEIYPFPNPLDMNETSALRFQNVPASASLYIYNVAGDRIRNVEANGTSTIRTWNLTNERAEPVRAGIYLYVVENEGTSRTGKFSILR